MLSVCFVRPFGGPAASVRRQKTVSRLRLSPVALRPGLAAGLPFSGAGETITLDYWELRGALRC